MKKYVPYLLFFCLVILAGSKAAGQSLKITAKFDTSAVTIGDQFKFRVSVEQPAAARVQWPSFSDTLTGKIEILGASPFDTVKNASGLTVSRDYLVTCFDSGYYNVPAIAFPFQMGAVNDTLYAVPSGLTVNTIPMDTVTQIKDIVPPMNTPFILAEAKLYIFIAIGLIFLVFLVWFLVKKLRKEPIFTQRKIYEPPHVIALRDLDKLRGQKLWQNNRVKDYYTRLTEILRIYIEERFRIAAMEQTSDEILRAFAAVYLEDQNLKPLLQKIFTTSDLVKFAKSEPLPDENEICLLDAYQFINNTKPVSAEPAVKEEEGKEDGEPEQTQTIEKN